MKLTRLVLVLLFAFISAAWAQDTQSQTPPASSTGQGAKGQMPHHQHMMEMHKQEMDAMKADVAKMKSSLEQMKAEVAKISAADEKARWQTNVDMWQTLVDHMDRMLHHMESTGPGMGPMAGPPPSPKQPQ